MEDADYVKPAYVAVNYLLSEQSPDRLEKMMLDPLEHLFFGIPGVSKVTSTAGHGEVNFEVRFEGAASEHDLVTVSKYLDGLSLDVVVTSRTVRLVSPPE
jgi:multidrug efflux pump subunit AcrB